MTFKKIDWLRHLYHEATKWQNSVKGQIQWTKMDKADPNNGSKFTVAQLEAHLPSMLEDCLKRDLVPSEYKTEVQKCLKYLKKEEKFVLKDIESACQKRKITISVVEIFCEICHLSRDQKAAMLGKLKKDCLSDLYSIVLKMKTRTDEVSSSTESDFASGSDSHKFKLIDYLRHMYCYCHKILSNRQGQQLQWKQVQAAKDPNNGARMKQDELKKELTDLVPRCLKLDYVPEAYLEELKMLQEILVGGKDLDSKKLEAEERLRKIALKITDVLLGLDTDEVIDEVIASIDETKMVQVCMGVRGMEHLLRTNMETNQEDEDEHDEVEDEHGEAEGEHEDAEENEGAVLIHDEALVVQEMDTVPDLLEMEIENFDSCHDDLDVIDGTVYFEQIIDQASSYFTEVNAPAETEAAESSQVEQDDVNNNPDEVWSDNGEDVSETMTLGEKAEEEEDIGSNWLEEEIEKFAKSPSVDSEGSSEPLSPLSPGLRASDGNISDDSGVFSPASFHNFDDDSLEDMEKLASSVIDDLDFSCLKEIPTDFGEVKISGKRGAKRKLSFDEDTKVMKKARP